MASIQSLGAGSGLLTSELVEDIVAAEREATDLRLDAKKAEFEAKISAYGAIRSGLDALTRASGKLGDSDQFLVNTVTSTDESSVTASADATATPAIHTVEVLATARAHSLVTARYDSIDDVVGEGTIDIRFGTTTFTEGTYDTFEENPERAAAQITIDSTNNTLVGMRDAINTAAVGVTATLVNDGQGFVLVLTSDQTGKEHSMEITVTEGANPGLSVLNYNATDNTPGTHLTQSVEADDASVVVNGIAITRDTNVVRDVVSGVTFNINGMNVGEPAQVTVAQDTSAIVDRLQTFVDAFNELKALTDDLTDFDSDEGVGSLLTGDSTVRTLLSQMRKFMYSSVDDVEATGLRALVDLGLSTNQNADYALQFNALKFQSALSANPEGVVALLADQTRASDSQISVTYFQSDTVAGNYEVEVTTAATQGTYVGSSVAGLAGPITIDDDNDTLSVTVDGVTSGTITLAQGSYTDGTALAVQLQTQINQDANLKAAGKEVFVTYDTTEQTLTLGSTTYGSKSNIGIDALDTNTVAELGLAIANSDNNVGQDVAGTINGIEGLGVGQFLSIPSGPAAATQGTYKGQAISGFETAPLTIDATNDTFRLSLDGVISNDINLTLGDYSTGSELASEIQAQINADPALSAAGHTATVSWDGANSRFVIKSDAEGLGSQANITFAEAGVVSDLGLLVAQGEKGKNASSIPDNAAGLQIQVQGDALGERGTVTLVRGVMNQIEAFLKNFTGATGTLTNKVNSLDEQVAEVNDEAADFSKRMNVLEERLRTQFAAADALIATLNNTSDFLKQQLASLPGYSRENK